MSIQVHPYNPAWPSHFLTLKARLDHLLKDIPHTRIEHLGSTSVPHLPAAPIIDIDIITTRSNVLPAIAALTAAGFTNMGELDIGDAWCVQDAEQDPRRNVHVCVDGAVWTRDRLALRDALRRDAVLREEYAAVEVEFAAGGADVVGYGEAKSGIVGRILMGAGRLGGEEKGRRFGAVKTERLVLREFTWGDEEAYFGLEGREEVVRYQTWGPRTREEAGEQVASIIKGSVAVPRTHVELAVEHEGRFIGRVGTNVNREGDAHADLWFSFLPEVQGKGFATEAMKAFIPLLGTPLELEIECDPRNTGSWKLAERLKFERFELTERAFECKGEWVGSLVYRKHI